MNYSNINAHLGPLINNLQKLSQSEYVVLRHELAEVNSEEQYRQDVLRLDNHLALAAQHCLRFGRLTRERSRPGKDVANANRMVLDKLAEIRAVVGLHRSGFENIVFRETPDLSVDFDGKTLAVEVTRLSSSPLHPLKLVEMLADGDDPQQLANEILGKVASKQAQLNQHRGTYTEDLIWVSLGRDYFTAGLYERPATALRARFSGYASDALSLAVSRIKATLTYPELSYVALCPGRDMHDYLREVT